MRSRTAASSYGDRLSRSNTAAFVDAVLGIVIGAAAGWGSLNANGRIEFIISNVN